MAECLHKLKLAISKDSKSLTMSVKNKREGIPLFLNAYPVKVAIESEHEIYSGDYEVVPKFADQVLETKSKILTKDVTVKEITVTSVSNASGGNTVWIGEV